MLNLDLNNFGGGGQAWKEVFFFLIYSLYFLRLPCTRRVGQPSIARWRGNCCPFLVFLGLSWHSSVGGGAFEREIENTVLGSPCVLNNVRYSTGRFSPSPEITDP